MDEQSHKCQCSTPFATTPATHPLTLDRLLAGFLFPLELALGLPLQDLAHVRASTAAQSHSRKPSGGSTKGIITLQHKPSVMGHQAETLRCINPPHHKIIAGHHYTAAQGHQSWATRQLNKPQHYGHHYTAAQDHQSRATRQLDKHGLLLLRAMRAACSRRSTQLHVLLYWPSSLHGLQYHQPLAIKFAWPPASSASGHQVCMASSIISQWPSSLHGHQHHQPVAIKLAWPPASSALRP
eukprot:1161030-Pelagomonas_calceolata.AAC.4